MSKHNIDIWGYATIVAMDLEKEKIVKDKTTEKPKT